MTKIHDHLDLSKHQRNADLDKMIKFCILMAVFSITFILARGY